jgi:hypothetical protein
MSDNSLFRDMLQPLQDPLGDFNKHGALPPATWAGPGPMAGPTGQFNDQGSILSDIKPYSYDPSFSSEMAYLSIPHSVPKIIPLLKGIPEAAEHSGCFALAHAVSYGGLAFAMRVSRSLVGNVVQNEVSKSPREKKEKKHVQK